MTTKPTPPGMQPLPNGRNRMPSTAGSVIEPVEKRFFGALPPLAIGHVYVAAYRDGHLRTFRSTPGRGDLRGAHTCFRVDTTEHGDSRFCTLRSSVDAYSFSVTLGATWRVTDPEAAVVAGPAVGASTVLDTLEQDAWQIARTFSPQQPAQVEEAIRSRCSGLMLNNCGLTVVRAWARFSGDTRIAEAVIGADEERYKADITQKRLQDLTSIFGPGTRRSLLYHLSQHPEDSASLLAAEEAQSQQDRDGFFGLLDRLLSNNLLNDADAQALRDRVLAGPAAFQSSSPDGTAIGPAVTMVPIVRQKPQLSLPADIDDGEPAETTDDDAGASPPGGITWEPIRRPRRGNT